jgi:hypothetical protein
VAGIFFPDRCPCRSVKDRLRSIQPALLSAAGHSRPGRTGNKSGHVRYAAESRSRPEL